MDVRSEQERSPSGKIGGHGDIEALFKRVLIYDFAHRISDLVPVCVCVHHVRVCASCACVWLWAVGPSPACSVPISSLSALQHGRRYPVVQSYVVDYLRILALHDDFLCASIVRTARPRDTPRATEVTSPISCTVHSRTADSIANTTDSPACCSVVVCRLQEEIRREKQNYQVSLYMRLIDPQEST